MNRSIGSIAVGLAVFAALALPAGPAAAQMELALGKPLPISSMPAGSISVRVVRGNMSTPITGVEVALTTGDGGSPKVARTGPQGRATFSGLKVGGTYVAKVTVDENELATEAFQVPTTGGLAFLLSPVPLEAMSAPPAAGGGGGDSLPPIMREPRRISGKARPESKDPPGQITVRLVQGKFRQTEAGIVNDFPEGAKVILVGYHADGTVTAIARAVDDEGRIRFPGLIHSSSSYYALAALERENGTVDRVVSESIQLPPKIGMRVLLAGEARDSSAPPIDDGRPGATPPAPPGQINLMLDATPDQQPVLAGVRVAELVDATTGKVVSEADIAGAQVRPEDVIGRGEPLQNTNWNLKPGQAGFMVIRMSNREPQAGVTVSVSPEGAAPAPGGTAPAPDGTAPTAPDGTAPGTPAPGAPSGTAPAAAALTAQTGSNGIAVFEQLQPGTRYVATATVRGKVIKSAPFSPTEGQPLGVAFVVDWPPETVRRAVFTGVASPPDAVYFARVRVGSRELVSPPMVLTAREGATTSVFLAPPILFGFHGGGEVDDARFWFEMRLAIYNSGNRPLDPGKDGLLIPLPKGFVGATVEESMSTSIKIEKGQGLRFIRPIPPGQKNFNMSFALPVEDGVVDFNMALPYGLAQSSLMLGETPGVSFQGIPASVRHEVRELNGKKFRRYAPINVAPQRALAFKMSGLPQPPSWHRWLRGGVGVVLGACILWVGIVIFRRRADDPRPVVGNLRMLEKKRERLLDELVRLEARRKGRKISDDAYQRDRDKRMKQLEEVWEQLGEGAA